MQGPSDDPIHQDEAAGVSPGNRANGTPGARLLAAAADWVSGRTGVMRLVLSSFAGTLAALAMAPYHLVPLLFVALTILCWQIDGLKNNPRPLLSAALVGWAFGTGFFALGLYWVGHAFLVDAATFGALMPAAIAALSIGLALFPAATIGIARLFWTGGPERIVLLALAWSASEWIRGHVLSGFPWNLFAYAWGNTLEMLQVSSLIGSYGLSLLTCLAAGAPALLVDFASARAAPARLKSLILPGALIVLLAGNFVYGALRLREAEAPDVPGIKLRLVQPSVPQRDKVTNGNAARIFWQHIGLMSAPGASSITHFIWPEAAVPVLLSEDGAALAEVASKLAPGQWLIAGSARYEPSPDGTPGRYFNSLHVISSDGAVAATYDKHHLVPFGEYLPLPWLLERIGLRQLVENESGFTSGARHHTIVAPPLPAFGPLICYEAIFPGAVTEPGRRPSWLLNITDDTWFGLGAGPRQHFETARVRAIEEGLPLIRAANNGISAVIDAKGRVRRSLALNVVGVLDSPLPAAGKPTFFARFGGLCTLVLVIAVTLLYVFLRRTKL